MKFSLLSLSLFLSVLPASCVIRPSELPPSKLWSALELSTLYPDPIGCAWQNSKDCNKSSRQLLFSLMLSSVRNFVRNLKNIFFPSFDFLLTLLIGFVHNYCFQITLLLTKAEFTHPVSACVYCIVLRFLITYLDRAKPR